MKIFIIVFKYKPKNFQFSELLTKTAKSMGGKMTDNETSIESGIQTDEFAFTSQKNAEKFMKFFNELYEEINSTKAEMFIEE